MTDLTPAAIESALKRSATDHEDEWLADGAGRGEGRLLLRATPSGGRWMFRYTAAPGRRDTLAMGSYASPRTKDAATGAAYSLKEARDKAREWGALLKSPETRDIRAYLERQHQAAARARQRHLDAKAHTLRAMLNAYCDHLDARGRSSAPKVREELTRHVYSAHEELAALPACEITRTQIAKIVRDLVDDGKQRTAGMIRSYLHAAYALALSAEADATAPAALIPFQIAANPVAGIKALPVGQRTRVLSEKELRHFLRRLDAEPGIAADILTLCLLSGGQRPQQVVRAEVSHYDGASGVLRLSDPKGRRHTPREHLLPLGNKARALVERLAESAEKLAPADAQSKWLFSSDGKVPADRSTPSSLVTELSKAMAKAGEAAPFQMKDLRRTAETMLASMGISRDTRAQLLSHGLSGVQGQRYDRHSYADEKAAALRAWEDRLTSIKDGKSSTKVVELSKKRQGKGR